MVSNTSDNKNEISMIHASIPLLKKCKKEPTKKQEKHQLFKFILSIIDLINYSNVIRWTNEEKTEIQFVRPHVFAEMYGAFTGKTMRFDDIARQFRHLRMKGYVSKVEGVSSTWRFLCSPAEIINSVPFSNRACEPVTIKRTREEATPEELEWVMEALRENLAPFDKFLMENKEVQQLEFQQQIDCYLKRSG